VTQRYKAVLEYNGQSFVGWQKQANGLSVQEVFENALARLFPEKPEAVCSGRTDAGVHARGQVVHFDAEREISVYGMGEALNHYLKPHLVSALHITAVSSEFHARFNAKSRIYCYEILNRRARPALSAGKVWHVNRPLQLAAMQKAVQYFLGQHDYSTFRAADCQAKSPVRTVDRAEILQAGEKISFIVEARSFLHRQIRSMVGSLVAVGLGKAPPEYIRDILAAKDRTACGPVAPPDGLYFEKTLYE
jgi:tRNA pseudouridine38-40 synthase